jgi:RNA polymerase sigma-70 factor (ECF subfamily)
LHIQGDIMQTSPGSVPTVAGSTKPPQTREASSQFEALLGRAQNGDQEAFAALIADARPRALAVAVKVLRNPDDAEDAVQEAFLKVWRYLGRFEGRSSFSTWIHRIVMNASLDLLRRQTCRPETHPTDQGEEGDHRPTEAVDDETPEQTLVVAQTGALVRSALAALSPTHQQALTLREFEDRSYEEIAEVARIPIGTVMSRLHHARRKLAEELTDVFTAEEPPSLRAA